MSGEQERPAGDMTPDELEDGLRKVAAWVVGYRRRIGDLPVLSRVEPGQVRAAMPPRPPAHGEPVDAWVEDLDRFVVDGVTGETGLNTDIKITVRWTSPRPLWC